MSSPQRRRIRTAPVVIGMGVVVVLTACGTRQSTQQLAAAQAGLLGAGPAASQAAAGGAAAPAAAGAPEVSPATTTPSTATGGGPVGTSAAQAVTPVAGSGGQGAAPVTAATKAAAGTAATNAAGTKTGTTARAGSPTSAATSPAAAAADSCPQQGTPLVIGQVGGWTGLVSNAIGGARPGLAAWVKWTNAHGGVACHPVVLYSEDDGSDPSKSAADVQDLVQNKHVVAIVGSAVPIPISGFRSAVESAKIPAVGGDSLNPDWSQSPYLFPQGTTFDATIIGAVKQLVDAGKAKLGIVYCVEAANCTSAAQLLQNGGAAKAGAQTVYNASISITQTDYTAQCQAAKSAGAQQLLLAMDGSAIDRFAKSCAAIGYSPAISTSAIAISSAQAQDPNVVKDTVSLAVTQFPWMQSDNQAEKDYQSAMAQYASGVLSDGSTSAAWAAGQMFKVAVEKLGTQARGPVTTAMVLQGLGMLKNETLGGLVPPITFTPGQSHAPEQGCYYPVMLQGTWTAPKASSAVCIA